VLEFVIEAMVDAVFVIDADGRITLSNAGAEQLTGYSRDELRTLPIAQLLLDDSSGLRTVVRRRIEDGSVLRRQESWIVTRTGERVPVSVTGSPVLDDAKLLQGIVLVARDIREMRQLLLDKEAEIKRRRDVEDELRAAKSSIEAQLDEARQQLLLAERRATLGTLAGGVGHELRNIAQVQVAAVDELAHALATDEIAKVARHLLPELERVGEHITQHGHRLMQLARPGPDRVAPIVLHDVVRDVAAMLGLAGKLGRVHLAVALPDQPVTVTVNRTRIEQILVNLIINAVDACAPAGTITVSVLTRDPGRVTCSVHDTGSGIPGDILEKIFEPFFTTKGDHGTGLGLPVVREIVTSYGGTLTVDSAPGAGTTFTFDLPA
jgi:PAS domain S-box-containing protein